MRLSRRKVRVRAVEVPEPIKRVRVTVERGETRYIRRGDPVPVNAVRQPTHHDGKGEYYTIGFDRITVIDGNRTITHTWEVKKLEWIRAEQGG